VELGLEAHIHTLALAQLGKGNIMAINYPKFDKKIDEQIQSAHMQRAKTRMGTIAQYDKHTNTAVIILESNYSDTIGGIIKSVSCPIVYRSTDGVTRTRRQMYSWIQRRQ
jgi:hypothetical protein